jgi:nucleotide-binding universal stress UspA family protein
MKNVMTMLQERWLARAQWLDGEPGYERPAGERRFPVASGSRRRRFSALDAERAGRLRRILVATDFAAASTPAVERAAALAERCGAALTVLHVVDVSVGPAGGPAAEMMRGLRERARVEMRRLASWLCGRVAAQAEVAEGLAAEVIAEKSKGYDLLVVGKRRPGSGWNLFARHTAERVAGSAACPVMVVEGGGLGRETQCF